MAVIVVVVVFANPDQCLMQTLIGSLKGSVANYCCWNVFFVFFFFFFCLNSHKKDHLAAFYLLL